MAELAPQGWEELERDGRIELAVYVPAGTDVELGALGEVTEVHVREGWEERWRDFHRPVRVGPLWIGPPWERPSGPTGGTVVIDPGRAFGTGAHPTTRLCLELLLECEPGSVVDVGCGSGVLAVAAAKLGFAPVAALDREPEAVDATLANAAANGVEVEARVADGLSDPIPRSELVLANLELGLAQALAKRVECRRLITSGYLATDAPSFPGWTRALRRELDGWAAELLERRR
jgi:ribosomal protein L11 methyltransferase